MCMLVVGGDKIKSLKDIKGNEDKIIHWNGRKKSVANNGIPESVDVVIMVTTYLNHTTMKGVKSKAKKSSIPVIFAKNNSIDITKKMESFRNDSNR